MKFEQSRDVIAHAKKFHEQLSEYYHRLSEKANKQRVKLLLDYMSRHELHLEKSLEGYEEIASKKVLDSWFQFMSDKPSKPTFEELVLKPDMSIDDVINLGLKFDDCLVDLYREMADKAESQDVKEAFTNLLRMEEQEKHNFVRQAMRLMDL